MLIQEIDDYAFHLATILQYFKQQADAQNKPAEVPISALSNFMDKRGLDINPDTLKSLMTTDPVIKNLIKSFDGEKVTIECSLMGAGALRYPPKARKYKYVGEVIVGFSIGADGKVVDPVILESQPPGIFERSALKYVRSWRYAPPEHEGNNVKVDDVAVRIAFQPGR